MYGKRDADYPSETASRRPALTTRIHCDPVPQDESEEEAQFRREGRIARDNRDQHVRGSLSEDDDQLKKFNCSLREGLGGSQDI